MTPKAPAVNSNSEAIPEEAPGIVRDVPNPWLERRILNYAHQGGALEQPSSTMHAFRAAVENGATALEMDVHATADGQLVVCHDTTIDRTTNATGRIADIDLARLRTLDNAYWFVPGVEATFDAPVGDYALRGRAPKDDRFSIATMREVLEAFPDVFLNLDIKETTPTIAGYEDELARILDEFGRVDDVIVASFLDVAIERFHERAPLVHTSLATMTTMKVWQWVNFGGDPPTLLQSQVALQVPVETHGITVVNRAFVDAAHEIGLAVHVWTIDDEPTMQAMVALGVDGIITNLPTTLAAVLGPG